MEYKTPYLTKDMIPNYTILLPNMCETQFALVQKVFAVEGYHVEILHNHSSEVAQLGLKYVHNDTCYPALLTIGQFLDALNSGKYDLHHVCLAITQTGGGCRASNYLKLLRKALVKSGYGYIPVASINFSSLEKESRIPFTVQFGLKALAAVYYGDLLVLLRNQTAPYEIHKGDSDALVQTWIDRIEGWLKEKKNYYIPAFEHQFRNIVKDFANIPVDRSKPKIKVGIVGEIYVQFSPLGNNELQNFLESQDCEVLLPTLMSFAEYCIANQVFNTQLYGVKKKIGFWSNVGLSILSSIDKSMAKALHRYGYYAPEPFRKTMKNPEGIISTGVKMGEGWLLPADMVEMIHAGYSNIVCAQPFGCLPNHIVGKGVIRTLRQKYPEANITPIDYDPSATRVNQENRIKLMLSIAKEKMQTN